MITTTKRYKKDEDERGWTTTRIILAIGALAPLIGAVLVWFF